MKVETWIGLLTMYIPFIISYLIYKKIDKNYVFTKKINRKLTVKKEWKRSVIISSFLLVIFMLGMIGIYVIDFSDTLYYILGGIIFGISISLTSNINKLSEVQ